MGANWDLHSFELLNILSDLCTVIFNNIKKKFQKLLHYHRTTNLSKLAQNFMALNGLMMF